MCAKHERGVSMAANSYTTGVFQRYMHVRKGKRCADDPIIYDCPCPMHVRCTQRCSCLYCCAAEALTHQHQQQLGDTDVLSHRATRYLAESPHQTHSRHLPVALLRALSPASPKTTSARTPSTRGAPPCLGAVGRRDTHTLTTPDNRVPAGPHCEPSILWDTLPLWWSQATKCVHHACSNRPSLGVPGAKKREF